MFVWTDSAAANHFFFSALPVTRLSCLRFLIELMLLIQVCNLFLNNSDEIGITKSTSVATGFQKQKKNYCFFEKMYNKKIVCGTYFFVDR